MWTGAPSKEFHSRWRVGPALQRAKLARFTHASQRIGMATVATTSEVPRSWLRVDLSQGRNLLGLLFLLPAATFLLVFLTYPLGLGVWLAFTDTRIGREGVFVG